MSSKEREQVVIFEQLKSGQITQVEPTLLTRRLLTFFTCASPDLHHFVDVLGYAEVQLSHSIAVCE